MRSALTNFTRQACRGRRAGMVLACAAFVLTAVFVFSSGAAAAVSVQKKAAASAAVAAKTAAPVQAKAIAVKPAESAAKGMNTGIKVHGHWTIEVRNPDGKVVSHTEFENSYVTEAGVLPNVFSRTYTFGEWGIVLGNSSPSLSPCTATFNEPLSNSRMLSPTYNAINAPVCIIRKWNTACILDTTNSLLFIGPILKFFNFKPA